MDTNLDEYTVTFTNEAKNRFQEMLYRIHTIEAWYGSDHKKTCEAYRSYATVAAQIVGLGGRITKDGDLSLYGVTDFGIHYGVIWHGDRNANKHADTGEDLTGAPETGTWSTHS